MKKDIVKFVYYTDVHIQSNNPPSRLGDYSQDILDKIAQVMEIGNKNKVDFTYCGGDLFNHKRPMSNKHSLMIKLINVLGTSKSTNYCVVGNHDITSDDIQTLPEQPLGVLFEGGQMVHVDGSTVITKGKLKVHLDSYDFDEVPDWDEIAKKRKETEADVYTLGAHVYSCPAGGDLFGTKIFSYAELSVTNHDIYLLGHYHPDNGIEDETSMGKRQTFINPGSLSRGDYGDENLERKPNCVLVTITKEGDDVSWEAKSIPLKIKPPGEVFDLEKKEKLKEEKEETSKFVAELDMASEGRSEVKETEEEELKEITPDPVIFKKTMDYIQQARDVMSKAKV